jgi:hypothetical protein
MTGWQSFPSAKTFDESKTIPYVGHRSVVLRDCCPIQATTVMGGGDCGCLIFVCKSVSVVDATCRSADSAIAKMEVVFEEGCVVSRLKKGTFAECSMNSLRIPRTVEVLCEECCSKCVSLAEVMFEEGSLLKRVEIRALSGCGIHSLRIPRRVEVLCEECCSQCKSLSEVIFEEGSMLTRIERRAFYKCALTTVLIPRSVEVLGELAFCLCKQLREIEFEEGSELKRIESRVFWWCCAKFIFIPQKVEFLAGSAVAYINSFMIGPANENFYEDEFCLYNKSGSTLIRLREPLCHFKVPRDVEVLSDGCFMNSDSLAVVTFEEESRLKRIEQGAFAHCMIKCIKIPRHVEILGEHCFYESASLKEVIFEEGCKLKRIENFAFSECGMKSILIPRHVEFLG